VVRRGNGGGFGTVVAAMMFSSLQVLSFGLLKKQRLSGVFVWLMFPSDPDLCGGGDSGVRSIVLKTDSNRPVEPVQPRIGGYAGSIRISDRSCN